MGFLLHTGARQDSARGQLRTVAMIHITGDQLCPGHLQAPRHKRVQPSPLHGAGGLGLKQEHRQGLFTWGSGSTSQQLRHSFGLTTRGVASEYTEDQRLSPLQPPPEANLAYFIQKLVL